MGKGGKNKTVRLNAPIESRAASKPTFVAVYDSYCVLHTMLKFWPCSIPNFFEGDHHMNAFLVLYFYKSLDIPKCPEG
jgi:hypothetical protein